MVASRNTKQSNRSDLRRPNFSLWNPPQMAPVQLPTIITLAEIKL